MNYTLKIDGTNYTEYLSEEDSFSILSNIEDGLNNPICSTLEFTLQNRLGLENLFDDTVSPYGIWSSGLVVLQYDFPLSNLFEGYIDRESIEVDYEKQKIKIKAVGKEKQISDYLAKFDITQLFEQRDNDIDVRRRWGRGTNVRRDPNNYSYISSLVADIFEDAGFDSSDRIISIPYNDKFYFRYNPDRYGEINIARPVAIARNNTGNRNILPELSSGSFRSFVDNDIDTESYNFLLKEYSKLTNCVYFYSHKVQKLFFVPRHYTGLGDDIGYAPLVINEDNILADNYLGFAEQPYNAIALKFSDMDMVVYKDNSGVVVGGEVKFGINVPKGVTPTINNELPYGYFVGFSDSDIRYKLGLTLDHFNYSVYLDNAVEINMEADLFEYLRPDAGITGESDSIEEWVREVVWENFYNTLTEVKKRRVTVKGIYLAPLPIIYDSQNINCFSGEIDLWQETTTLEFKY